MCRGGRLNSLGSNAKLGDSKFLVAEADESDGTFLLLFPTIAVTTNIDLEHLDFYHDVNEIKAPFFTFSNKYPSMALILFVSIMPMCRVSFLSSREDI